MCRNLEPEVKKDLSFGEFEIVAEKGCTKCFLEHAVQHKIGRNPACRHVMHKITGIDCQLEDVSFKKVRDFTMATPRNTSIGDILYPETVCRGNRQELVVKYIYPEDCDKFGFAIVRNNRNNGRQKETEECLNSFVIEVQPDKKTIKKFTLESYRK